MRATTKINVKQAVAAAIAFIQEIYSSNLPELLLEEVSLSEDGKIWLITLGFSRERPKTGIEREFQRIYPFDDPKFIRVYKTIEVDAETGEAKRMKIRDPAAGSS
jgi:hypothetical protein